MKSKKSFWHSKINAARSCYEKYRIEYVDGSAGPMVKSDALEFGLAVHSGLEEALLGGDGVHTFTLYWDDLKEADIEYKRFDWTYLRRIGVVLLEKFQKYHLKHIKPEIVEVRQYGTVKGHMFEGTPDVAGVYKGTPSIIDFKTSAYRYDKAKIKIADQLVGYDLLLRNGQVYQAEQLVYMVFVKSTGSIQVLTEPLTQAMRERIIENTRLWIDDLKSRTQYPKNYNSCIIGQNKCPHFDRCHNDNDKQFTND